MSQIELSDHQKTFLTVSSQNQVQFDTTEKRNYCLSSFLAYHSKEIGKYLTENLDKKEYLSLQFESDLEVYQAMITSEKYSDKIKWEPVTEQLREEFDNKQDNLVLVVFRIGPTETNTFYTDPMKLYGEAQLPWVIGQDRPEPVFVYLSVFQREFYMKYQQDFTFYKNGDLFEPYIKDELRNKLLRIITERIVKIADQRTPEQVIYIAFKNGDKSILSAILGTIDYPFYEIVDKKNLEKESYYDQIKEVDSAVVVTTYIPETEKILYRLTSGL